MPAPLEDQLTALTREFVARLVDVIRNASLAEVAALSGASVPPVPSAPERATPAARGREPLLVREPAQPREKRAGRQTAASRAELGDQLTRALAGARQPLGVRALATSLGVEPAVLAVPLRELRGAGKIRKHGEKRATTYSLT